MKKATILFLFIFLFGSFSLVKAETIKHKDQTKIQATNPSMLIQLVTPTVNRAVKKEHGAKATWTPDKITKLSINNDHTVKPPKRWYEIKLNIHVQDPVKNEKHLDMAIIKINPKKPATDSLQKENLDDATITLLEYIHDVKQ
ncbi:hypothetical protein ACQKCU_02005 [Heyndrickxia sporothermodurans]